VVFEFATQYLPEFNLDFAYYFGIMTWAIIILIFGVIVAGIIYYFLMKNIFNKKIIIFEKVSGRYEPVGKDKAAEIKVGIGGDTIFKTKKLKKYLPRPRIRMGQNSYWFAIREDGEWINIGIEDIDQKMKAAKVHYLHEDMRYSRASLQKLLKDNYQKKTFLEKYGGVMAYSGLIIITALGVWLVADKMLDIVTQVAGQIDIANKLAERQEQILAAMDNICSPSGLR